MSRWQQHDMQERITQVLNAVHLNNPEGHQLGRPYLSSYQIAIALDAADQGLKLALDKEIGGVGTGAHHSLAQYVAQRLSSEIGRLGDDCFAEGAFMSNEHVGSITYVTANGNEVLSSLSATPFDLALFRTRQ